MSSFNRFTSGDPPAAPRSSSMPPTRRQGSTAVGPSGYMNEWLYNSYNSAVDPTSKEARLKAMLAQLHAEDDEKSGAASRYYGAEPGASAYIHDTHTASAGNIFSRAQPHSPHGTMTAVSNFGRGSREPESSAGTIAALPPNPPLSGRSAGTSTYTSTTDISQILARNPPMMQYRQAPSSHRHADVDEDIDAETRAAILQAQYGDETAKPAPSPAITDTILPDSVIAPADKAQASSKVDLDAASSTTAFGTYTPAGDVRIIAHNGFVLPILPSAVNKSEAAEEFDQRDALMRRKSMEETDREYAEKLQREEQTLQQQNNAPNTAHEAATMPESPIDVPTKAEPRIFSTRSSTVDETPAYTAATTPEVTQLVADLREARSEIASLRTALVNQKQPTTGGFNGSFLMRNEFLDDVVRLVSSIHCLLTKLTDDNPAVLQHQYTKFLSTSRVAGLVNWFVGRAVGQGRRLVREHIEAVIKSLCTPSRRTADSDVVFVSIRDDVVNSPAFTALLNMTQSQHFKELFNFGEHADDLCSEVITLLSQWAEQQRQDLDASAWTTEGVYGKVLQEIGASAMRLSAYTEIVKDPIVLKVPHYDTRAHTVDAELTRDCEPVSFAEDLYSQECFDMGYELPTPYTASRSRSVYPVGIVVQPRQHGDELWIRTPTMPATGQAWRMEGEGFRATVKMLALVRYTYPDVRQATQQTRSQASYDRVAISDLDSRDTTTPARRHESLPPTSRSKLLTDYTPQTTVSTPGITDPYSSEWLREYLKSSAKAPTSPSYGVTSQLPYTRTTIDPYIRDRPVNNATSSYSTLAAASALQPTSPYGYDAYTPKVSPPPAPAPAPAARERDNLTATRYAGSSRGADLDTRVVSSSKTSYSSGIAVPTSTATRSAVSYNAAVYNHATHVTPSPPSNRGFGANISISSRIQPKRATEAVTPPQATLNTRVGSSKPIDPAITRGRTTQTYNTVVAATGKPIRATKTTTITRPPFTTSLK